MRPLHPIIRRSLSFRHAVLADTCVIATLLSTTTYSLYGLQCKHAFANVCRHLVCVASASLASLASLLSTTTYSLYGLHDHAFGHVCRYLVSASLQRPLRRIASRSSVVRLRVVSLPAPSSLAARVSASLERPSPVDSGRRGSLSSIVFTRSVRLHTFACVIQRRTDTTLARHHVHWRSHIPV